MEINVSAGRVSEGSHLPLCKETHGHSCLWRVNRRGRKKRQVELCDGITLGQVRFKSRQNFFFYKVF